MTACKNETTPLCDSEVEHIAHETLEDLPNALTRLRYHAAPTYGDLPDEAHYALVEAPDWMHIDETTGALSGTPHKNDAHAHQTIRIARCAADGQRVWQTAVRTELNAKYRDSGGYDAYAHTYGGAQRALRDDLHGALAAEIQFLQSHAAAPAQNHVVNEEDQRQSRYMPSITANREALLLFLPHEAAAVHTVHVILRQHDNIVATLAMTHPNDLPHADNPTAWDVRYSARA